MQICDITTQNVINALCNFVHVVQRKILVAKVIKGPCHFCEITKSILTFIAQKRYTFKVTLNDMFLLQREIDEWIKKLLHI